LCLLLLRSWLSNVTSDYIFAAMFLAFQRNYLFAVVPLLAFKHYFLLRSCCYTLGFPAKFPTSFCCYAFGFPTKTSYCYVCCCYTLGLSALLPTTFLLLRFRLQTSNITSYHVLAATPWGFQHNLRLRFCCDVLVFPPQARSITFVAAMRFAFSHYFLFIVAMLLTFNHYILLRSCCYALGFQTGLLSTFLLRGFWFCTTISPYYVCCCNALGFSHYFLLRSFCYALGFRKWCCHALDPQFLLPTTFLLPRSWLSSIIPVCCCYALGFQILLPGTLRLHALRYPT